MSISSGLRFERFDLHVHTPASHDFPDKSITAEKIVEKAIAEGMRGIAITDHNTGDYIDDVKRAAEKNKKLTVFPGVEITCTGGEKGIHLIALLDTDKGKKHVDSLLATLKIKPDDYGKKDAVTTLSPFDAAEIIGNAPHNGIAILAHCTSSKGVLHDMKGATRKTVFNSKYILAVETSENDFTDVDKSKSKIRAIDLLNGKDENYNQRKLAVYISSDSRKLGDDKHTIEGVCCRYSLFKVDEAVTLESLRQCFIDRDVRIRQSFEYQPISYPYIEDITVAGGFFDGQTATFHQGLNSILGGKGVGKSLLVELMRFVLSQPSTQKDIIADHSRKLEKKLQAYGSVLLRFVDETGKVCTVERKYNPSDGNRYVDESHESLAMSFPALFLSQNEIIKIAEDESEQISFIDRFFDFRHYTSRIRLLEKTIADYDETFARGLRAVGDLKDISKQLAKLKIDLGKLDIQLKDPIYDNFKKIDAKNREFEEQKEYVDSLKLKVVNASDEINALVQPTLSEVNCDDPQLQRISDAIKSGKQRVLLQIEAASKEIQAINDIVENEYKVWTSKFSQEKMKYEKHIRDAGGDKKSLETQRLKVVKEMDELRRKEKSLQEEKKNLSNVVKKRNELIDELFEIYKDYSAERKKKCDKFENESNGRLKIKIETASNTDEFRERLSGMKKGTYLRDADVEAICQKMKPFEFIMELLRYQVNKDNEIIAKLNEKILIGQDKLQLLCDFLLAQINFEELMQLQYKAHPQDRPEIRFKISDTDYELIKDISVGQKCTAMLIMCLSDGKFPVIIDQPEDSLDVRSVWDDMCIKIRKGKESRQFIFTTHNSCLAVASDTDKYTIVDSDAKTGKIIKSGALDNSDVKEEVIKYLEGGRPTYDTKANKYGTNYDLLSKK